MASHALLSASSAARWLQCPESVRLTERLPDSDSIYAAEGTLAHELAEYLLVKYFIHRKRPETVKAIKRFTDNPLFYPGMVDDVLPYVNHVIETYHQLMRTHKPMVTLEERLDYSPWVRQGFGTGDAVLACEGRVEVIDLKFGKGVMVDAFRNPQLMLYGLGAYYAYDWLYDIKTVNMTIVQPRLDHISSYEMTIEDLLDWANHTVKPIAALAYEGQGGQKAGSWCRWCKIKATCKVRAAANLEPYQNMSDKELNSSEIAEILTLADDMAAWVKEVQEYALTSLLEGAVIPGWKVVEGRSNRKIIKPEALAESLLKNGYKEDAIYKPLELNTLTNLERLIGKKRFMEDYGNYVEKPKGKPTLAPEFDQRPAFNSADADFTYDE